MAHSNPIVVDQQGPNLPEDFPLRKHGNGQFYKKRKGQIYYFGKTDDWQTAYTKYLQEWPHILEHGCRPTATTPATTPQATTIRKLANDFLNFKRAAVEDGSLSPRSFLDYQLSAARVVEAFGPEKVVDELNPDDFRRLRAALAKGRSDVTLCNEIQRCRVMFKFAVDERLVERQVHYGQSFKKPSSTTLRKARNEKVRQHGKRMFEPAELRLILANASQPLRTMVLLAINTGMGQSDIANLRVSDIKGDWLDYPRVKTGVERRLPLWPETVAALAEWLPKNPKAKTPEAEGLAFITRRGLKWVKVAPLREANEDGQGKGGSTDDAVGKELDKLLRKLGLKRRGLSFYAGRHSFETVASGTLDQVGVNAIMGHTDTSMAAVYNEGLEDARLRRIVDHVHAWLFPPGWKEADAERAKEDAANE